MARYVLPSGGFGWGISPPEIESANFAPRVSVPTLVIHGRYDGIRPVATSVMPMFQLLGTDSERKRLALAEAGHFPPTNFIIRETVAWLDTYLGTVGRN